MRMPFGKYKGLPLKTVPTGYLCWLLSECDLSAWLKRAVEDELDYRAGEFRPSERPAEANVPASLSRIVQQWYRGLVMDYHPDRGGDTKAMQAINDAFDRLKKMTGIAS
jgi:hypothetical protein